jgi:hypothetical protein
VREALRKWNRGESVPLDKKPHDFTWRPAPATLARLARIERWVVAGRIAAMQQLLAAQPLVEYTPEHRADMLERLVKIMPRETAEDREARMRKAERLGQRIDRIAAQAQEAAE